MVFFPRHCTWLCRSTCVRFSSTWSRYDPEGTGEGAAAARGGGLPDLAGVPPRPAPEGGPASCASFPTPPGAGHARWRICAETVVYAYDRRVPANPPLRSSGRGPLANRILLVYRNARIRAGITEMLGDSQGVVCAAASLREAVTRVLLYPFDLVIVERDLIAGTRGKRFKARLVELGVPLVAAAPETAWHGE